MPVLAKGVTVTAQVPEDGFPPVRLPVEWIGAHAWASPMRPMKGLKHAHTGRWHYLMSGRLDDGTVIVALTWDGGCNAARYGPDTRWGIQEQVDPRAGDDTRDLWGQTVNMLARAHGRVVEEHGPPPSAE